MLTNIYSSRLLIKCMTRLKAEGRNARTYDELGFEAGGYWLQIFTKVVVFLNQIGYNVSYGVIMGTTIVTIVNSLDLGLEDT